MKKKKKMLLISGVAIAILVTVIIFVFSGSNKIQFKTVKVQKGDITHIVTATGNVNPVTTIIIGTRVSGTIVALYADYNSQVKKGQLIAQIDPTPFENELKTVRGRPY
jgi:Membrane-fusion protein